MAGSFESLDRCASFGILIEVKKLQKRGGRIQWYKWLQVNNGKRRAKLKEGKSHNTRKDIITINDFRKINIHLYLHTHTFEVCDQMLTPELY